MLYIGISLVLLILWLLPIVAIDDFISPVFFVWLILGQTILNLLAWMISLLHTQQRGTNAQTDHLPNHYKRTFSRKAKVHFLGIWFVTTFKSSVQAFAS
jgi:uncharacterized membrane protein